MYSNQIEHKNRSFFHVLPYSTCCKQCIYGVHENELRKNSKQQNENNFTVFHSVDYRNDTDLNDYSCRCFFIGNYVEKEGFAAVSLGLSIIYLYLGVGLMVSVGGVSIAGISFGSNDIKKCNSAFNQTMCTAVFLTVILSIIVWLCLSPMLYILNANTMVAGFF